MVDKKRHLCTVDIVLGINVGTRRTLEELGTHINQKSANTRKKTAQINHNISKRDHDKVSTTDNPPPPIMMLSAPNLYWHIRHKI